MLSAQILIISASMDGCRLFRFVVLLSVVAGTQHRQCPVGFYGSSCQHTCQMTCNNQQCNIDEVGRTFCIDGCVDGYRGISCRIPCPVNCQVCERVNGSCISCKATFHGTNCTLTCEELCQGFLCDTDQTCSKTTCLDGRYGQNCSNKCDPRYLTCGRSTGDCTACRDGYYGQNCEHDCPPCGFTRGSMDQICKDGCKTIPCADTTPGDSGHRSVVVGLQNRQCPGGFYGSSCQHKCPMTCNNQQCKIDEVGRTSCIDGCVDGYRGISCRIPCPVNCQVCERVNGSCISSVLLHLPKSLVLLVPVTLIAWILRLRWLSHWFMKKKSGDKEVQQGLLMEDADRQSPFLSNETEDH